MHSLYLFTFFTLLLHLSLFQTTTFYIDETSNSSNPDGSISNPFSNLSYTTTQLFPGIFDIILLGESITINDYTTFPPGSICIIRPEIVPESGHYPLHIDIYFNIEIVGGNVTFQDIQFIEVSPYRISENAAILLYGGFLCLNRVLLSDIQYRSRNPWIETSYPFISAGGESWDLPTLLLLDCQFKNLTSVQINASIPQVTIQNTTFENIQIDNAAFFSFDFLDIPNPVIRMVNISLVNSRFGNPESANSGEFVSLSGNYAEFSLEGFSAKNISITNRATLIKAEYTPIEGYQEYPRRINLSDFVLEDIVENEDLESIEYDERIRGVGLIFDLSGPKEVIIRNLTARNLKFESGSLLRYFPYVDSFLPYKRSPSQVSLQDIRIENSSNTSFLISFSDSGQVENVELLNAEFNTLPVFSFISIETVSIKNINGRNISGSFLSLEQVPSQNLQNLTFYNVSMSQENSLILLSRYLDMASLELFVGMDQSTVIADFFIDGSGYLEGEGNAYLMAIDAEFGTVLIRDSIWSNINTRSLFVSHMDALEMNNFTINGVPAQATSAE